VRAQVQGAFEDEFEKHRINRDLRTIPNRQTSGIFLSECFHYVDLSGQTFFRACPVVVGFRGVLQFFDHVAFLKVDFEALELDE